MSDGNKKMAVNAGAVLADVERSVKDVVDFKMVTFSLGGKDYGIDIMRIKEIAKFQQFTYVPNTLPFVRGVYNLRGDIISIIDLRLMFNLPTVERAEHEPENGLILRHEEGLLGVVVDSIDKVVGISKSSIQPPHPIFGDINVKFISGVVEYERRLYIILDAQRIFRKESPVDDARSTVVQTDGLLARASAQRVTSDRAPQQPPVGRATKEQASSQTASPARAKSAQSSDVVAEFIAEGLAAFQGFYAGETNQEWFRQRVQEWQKEREGDAVQLREAGDALRFLEPFFSPGSGSLWPIDYAEELIELLPPPQGGVYQVWNPGTGSGHEAYSLSCALRLALGNKQVKILAGDNDLLRISAAPNLTFALSDVPERWHQFLVSVGQGHGFAPLVKDAILFEFSDVLHAATLPKMDLIVARDLLSFHTAAAQNHLCELFYETLKPGGALVLGVHERPVARFGFKIRQGKQVRLYVKE